MSKYKEALHPWYKKEPGLTQANNGVWVGVGGDYIVKRKHKRTGVPYDEVFSEATIEQYEEIFRLGKTGYFDTKKINTKIEAKATVAKPVSKS